MKVDVIVEQTIRQAQDILWKALPSDGSRTSAVKYLRCLFATPDVRNALKTGNDNLLAFTLRAVHRILADHSSTDEQTYAILWPVLDSRDVNEVLSIAQSSRMKFR